MVSPAQFSFLTDNPSNFVPAHSTKVFVSTPYNPDLGETAEVVTITAVQTSTVLPPSLSDGILTTGLTSDVDVTLYEGTKLDFGSGNIFYLAEQVDVSDTVADVTAYAASNAAAPAENETCALSAFYPYFSANSLNISYNGEENTDNAFSDGNYAEKRVIGYSPTCEISGPVVKNDPGLTQVEAALVTTKVINVDVIYADRTGRSFTATVTDLPESNERNAFRQLTASLGISGPVTRF